MSRNTNERTSSVGNHISGYLHDFFSAEGIEDKRLEKQIEQLLKSTIHSIGHLNPRLIKSLVRDVFLGATSFNGSLSKSKRILEYAKMYYKGISCPCSADVHIFHCISFYVQAESKKETIVSGLREILKHRKALIAFPKRLQKLVIAGACDGFTFGDKQVTLDYMITISQNCVLLMELPIGVSNALLSQAIECVKFDALKAYPRLLYVQERVKSSRRNQAEIRSELGLGPFSKSQVDSLFLDFDLDLRPEVDDLPKIFSFAKIWKAELSSVSHHLREICTKRAIRFFKLHGYTAPPFLNKIFALARRFPRHRKKLESIYGSLESIYVKSRDTDQMDFLLDCFLDRGFLFNLPKPIFMEILVEVEANLKETYQACQLEPCQVLQRAFEIMDYDPEFMCSIKGKHASEVFSGLIGLGFIRDDDGDGVKAAKLIIDFAKEEPLCFFPPRRFNGFVRSATNLTVAFGGNADDLLPELLKLYTQKPAELKKEVSHEGLVALKNFAMVFEDNYLLRIARQLEGDELSESLRRIIDKNIAYVLRS
jgi:hypothetical protein